MGESKEVEEISQDFLDTSLQGVETIVKRRYFIPHYLFCLLSQFIMLFY